MLPTSEEALLGARAAEVWPCAPAQLSLSHCRPGDVRREGGGGGGGVVRHIQRAGTMTVPSAVVSLQRPPPPLILGIRTEECSRRRWSERRGSKNEWKKSRDGSSASVYNQTHWRRVKINTTSFSATVLFLPAPCYLGGPLNSDHSERSVSQGERVYEVTSSAPSEKTAAPSRSLVGVRRGQRKRGSREVITKRQETGPSYCYCSWPNHDTMGP